jgi:hypothetical protein
VPEFMPYTTEKSQVFQVMESWANGDRLTALEALWDLIEGEPISDFPVVGSSNIVGDGRTVDQRRAHIREDWWGWEQPAPARGQGDQFDPNQKPYDPTSNPTTGFWQHWYGNAEGVFRETMIRALAVSLGLPRTATRASHGGAQAARPGGQHWPISVLWKCPCPWYEGWIEFKRYPGGGPNDGHVTVVLSTPAHGVKLFDSPVQPGAVVNPVEPAGKEGLWVVSQAVHLMVQNPPRVPEPQPALPDSTASPAGTWGPPTLGQPVRSVGSVVCVAPQIGDGGVNPGGMPYLP